jgi:2-polyprenyl-3-methyl-5-hydroxy-6-metoxy-1,4-benzoquinol methylase
VDLGCGNGALCKNLYDSGFNVCGIDSDANAIEIAKSAYPGIKFFNKSVYDEVDYINEKTNIVVSTEVIEHLYDPSELFHYADTVLSEDGVLILSTVYHGYFKNLIISLLNNWDKHWLPEWEGGHIKFWSKKSLTIFAQEHNYKLVFFRGVGRLPFLWKSMILVFVKSN